MLLKDEPVTEVDRTGVWHAATFVTEARHNNIFHRVLGLMNINIKLMWYTIILIRRQTLYATDWR